MFLGTDHGTTAVRFATSSGRCFEIERTRAAELSPAEIVSLVKEHFGTERVDLLALTYSMGDGLNRIVKIEDAKDRGLLRQDGAGKHIGGGTAVFEAVRSSGWPAVLLPGIHRGSSIDPRLKVFSHGMSPEKVGLAYSVYRRGICSFVVCDASSNTVTFAVQNGRIVGAIDAPIFAPGLIQGPLDVEAIRNIDSGLTTANQAFSSGGILRKQGISRLDDCSPEEASCALESLALFAAMEIAAICVLMRDLGEEHPSMFLAGSPAARIVARVSELLSKEVIPLDRCSAAIGCAQAAEDIYRGQASILGIEVDERVRALSQIR
jgi:putative methanogenesis marker protein 12